MVGQRGNSASPGRVPKFTLSQFSPLIRTLKTAYCSIFHFYGPGLKARSCNTYWMIMDKITKCRLVYFIHVSICHYGGLKVFESLLEGPSSFLVCLLMLQYLSLSSMLGALFLDNTNIFFSRKCIRPLRFISLIRKGLSYNPRRRLTYNAKFRNQ